MRQVCGVRTPSAVARAQHSAANASSVTFTADIGIRKLKSDLFLQAITLPFWRRFVSLWRKVVGSEICDQVWQTGRGESILPLNCVTSFMDVLLSLTHTLSQESRRISPWRKISNPPYLVKGASWVLVHVLDNNRLPFNKMKGWTKLFKGLTVPKCGVNRSRSNVNSFKIYSAVEIKQLHFLYLTKLIFAVYCVR